MVYSLVVVEKSDTERRERSDHRRQMLCETPELLLALTLLLRHLQLLQVDLEAVEALVPQIAIMLEPVVDALEGDRLDAARPPLRLAPARDQAGAFQHLEMLRYRRQAHRKGLGEFRHRGFPKREPRQDGPARRVGKGCERSAE